MTHDLKVGAGLIARLRSWFPDYELHLMSGDKIRFIKISSALQLKVVAIAGAVLVAWLAFTLIAVGLQVQSANQRFALERRAAAVADTAGRVEDYRASIDERLDGVRRRQAALDAIVRRHFGDIDYRATQPADGGSIDRISAILPEAGAIARIERRQLAFAAALGSMVEQRTRRAENAIREFGLDPLALGRQAMGGPYLPARPRGAPGSLDGQIDKLEIALNRLAATELSLRAIPSMRPTTRLLVSSPFGLRFDPFDGSLAMHSGLDIRGGHGQGIRATAGGRVVEAGAQGGYGMMIEIDHGAGMRTRYAHLSGVEVYVGERVERGQRIGRMGSTGRSTATHLHYEVRVNGRAIDPRPFLEANPDVLEIQSIADRRDDSDALARADAGGFSRRQGG